VLSPRELRARVDILVDQYATVVGIEARTLVAMLRTRVLPAAQRHQTELAETVAATQAAGLSCPDATGQLERLIEMIAELHAAITAVEDAETSTPDNGDKQARHVRDRVLPAMERARVAADALEHVIPDDLWPLPTYAEMLFIR
jgi:glutamine synthetase